MDLIVLFGPPAVGKMTVGRELARLTGLRLFHNHAALEPVLQVFPFGSAPFNRLVQGFRDAVFREVADSTDIPGLIYTLMWDLAKEEEKTYVDEVCASFRMKGAGVHFVELYAPLEERLRRNRTELRLREKPSKRDIEASEQRLRSREHDTMPNTVGGFYYPESHLRIDNTDRSPEDVARMIIDRFNLRLAEPEMGGTPKAAASEPITIESTSSWKSKVRAGAAALTRQSIVAAEQATTRGKAVLEGAAAQIKEVRTEMMDRLMPECPVPAFLLPTGPGSADFICDFDFQDAVRALKRGVLVRPRVIAWAGREDVNPARLGALLKEQFTKQFHEQKLSYTEADPGTARQISRIQGLEKTRDSAGSRLETAFKVTAAALGALLLVTNPVADLLFLVLALFGGSSAVAGLFQQLKAGSDLRAAEGALERTREEIERDLDISSTRFKEAVENIEVRIHPALREISNGICELEGRPQPLVADNPNAPRIAQMLTSTRYTGVLDPAYEPFLRAAVSMQPLT